MTSETNSKPRLELRSDVERAGKNRAHRKPISKNITDRSWLPSSLQRTVGDAKQEPSVLQEKQQSLDPDKNPNNQEYSHSRGTGSIRGRGRGRHRGKGTQGEHQSRSAGDTDHQQTVNSGSPPNYPSSRVETRGRRQNSRGRGGLKNSGQGNDSPGQM